MTIKHLVLSGGGPSGLLIYGSSRYLSKQNFWNINDIESIYACSIGSILSVILMLKYEWDILDDYLIKRPWDKVINNSLNEIVDLYYKCGLLNNNFIIDILKSLLLGKELNINITMKEFYNINKIDFHIYSTNVNSEKFEKIDISHTTHPELELIKAIRMSSALPIMFEPIYLDDKCYIDGAVLNNLPLNECIIQKEPDLKEILVFRNDYNIRDFNILNSNSTLIDYINVLFTRIRNQLSSEDEQPYIDNTVICSIGKYDIDQWLEILSLKEKREELINIGDTDGKNFYIKYLERLQ